MQTVKVKSALPQEKDGGFPLAIHERHEDHKSDENPEGDLFIADDEIHDVVLTVGVRSAINEGRLVEVNARGNPVNQPTMMEDEEAPAPNTPNTPGGKTGGDK